MTAGGPARPIQQPAAGTLGGPKDPYRWIILVLYMALAGAVQLAWATFFSVSDTAADHYRLDSEAPITALSIIFLAGTVLLTVPALAAFERFGYRRCVGSGAVLLGVAALGRGVWSDSYLALVVCTLIFSVSQPLVLNAVGLVAGRWFPGDEQATANGLGLLSNYVGIVIGLLLTPMLLDAGASLGQVLGWYGVATAAVCVAFVGLTRERPAGVPDPRPALATTAAFKEHVGSAFGHRAFVGSVLVFFGLLGIFNAFFTVIESVLSATSGGTVDSTGIGVVGATILLSAVIGSVVIPLLSDRDLRHARVWYFLLPNIVGLAGFCSFLLSKSLPSMICSAAVFGFFCIGTGPIIMTFAAELAHPVPSGTSEGLLLFAGNLSGALFLIVPSLIGDGIPMLWFLLGVYAAAVAVMATMRTAPDLRHVANAGPVGGVDVHSGRHVAEQGGA